MLRLAGISCSYGKVRALSDVSLHIEAGELVTLIGANGAGKSTLLRTVSGLLRPTAGRIEFEGRDITRASARDILIRGIAHCPEGRRVFPQMSVDENLQMGCYLRSDRGAIEEDKEMIFERFPVLKERRRQAAGLLSGGEQQMLAIGRALMSRPRLLLFDEPSLGLAPQLVERTFEIIARIKKQGTTVLLVEQNAFAALAMCDRAYLLETGNVTLEGSGPELLGNDHVRRAYLGG
jgi:branched-chain amino acid transport system ATP-binding protein